MKIHINRGACALLLATLSVNTAWCGPKTFWANDFDAKGDGSLRDSTAADT
jgi:hypothetical protein